MSSWEKRVALSVLGRSAWGHDWVWQNFDVDFERPTSDWVIRRVGIQAAKYDDWAHNQGQDKQSEPEANNELLPERLKLAEFVAHVWLVSTLGNVHVCLNLCEFDPLEHVKSSLREGPIDDWAQLEDEWNGEVRLIRVLADLCEAIDQEASTPDRWQAKLDLVRT